MIDDTINALARGEAILLYDFDDRERETELAGVIPYHWRSHFR